MIFSHVPSLNTRSSWETRYVIAVLIEMGFEEVGAQANGWGMKYSMRNLAEEIYLNIFEEGYEPTYLWDKTPAPIDPYLEFLQSNGKTITRLGKRPVIEPNTVSAADMELYQKIVKGMDQ